MSSPPIWREVQRQNFTDWKKLLDFLEIEEESRPFFLKNPRFPLNLPLRIAEKIEKNNIDDPLLRQFVPLSEETLSSPGFLQDPVGDMPSRKEKKLLHKYKGRALILTTGSCAMNCRFCFRQNFPYETETKDFTSEIEAIKKEPSLTEVLLSGGDPLSLSDRVLGDLFSKLSEIPHLKRLRIHTRFPIGIPERIDSSFLEILSKSRLQIIFTLHTNHPREMDTEIAASLRSVFKLGIPILTQTVLLKGVNDDLPTLKELFENLSDIGILPYYLHQLDKVQGAKHFEVEISKGRQLMKELQKELPGYAIPRYVQEIAGIPHKTDLMEDFRS